ncbi:hypothetical protein C3489_27615 [Streptomyces sp. Ru71]|uniref:ABC transporter substrate-binding protein n=1 Tax=Streptomyces sp. Ru71 TaxID=2080746 RepID=UPI000CDD7223|nr:extracellular solute-binding protein [Streptomyces sp. Ru71]POX48263.1 hypothetical protein C3489_27615 [Streptomyces sp. Ru71]
MKRSAVRLAGAGGGLVLALAATGCSESGSDTTSADGKISITFWGWAPGYADAVAAFNKSHPDIRVIYQAVQPGAKGGYQKMLNVVKAGNAPCLAQVGYETLPSFAAQGALKDVHAYRSVQEEAEFPPAAWNAVSVGDQVYGAPVDTGPMALFYNKKAFDELHLKVVVGSLVSVVPLLIAFLALQRFWRAGMTAGALK